jgi:hypothetical protein
MFCCQTPICGINPKTQARKGLISYYKTNGITFFLNVWMQITLIAKKFKEKMNGLLKEREEREP